MEVLGAAAEVLLEAALVAEVVGSMTGPPEMVTPSMQAPPRRPTGGGAAVAAARMGEEVAVAVAPVKGRRVVPLGDSTIARTAPDAGGVLLWGDPGVEAS